MLHIAIKLSFQRQIPKRPDFFPLKPHVDLLHNPPTEILQFCFTIYSPISVQKKKKKKVFILIFVSWTHVRIAKQLWTMLCMHCACIKPQSYTRVASLTPLTSNNRRWYGSPWSHSILTVFDTSMNRRTTVIVKIRLLLLC